MLLMIAYNSQLIQEMKAKLYSDDPNHYISLVGSKKLNLKFTVELREMFKRHKDDPEFMEKYFDLKTDSTGPTVAKVCILVPVESFRKFIAQSLWNALLQTSTMKGRTMMKIGITLLKTCTKSYNIKLQQKAAIIRQARENARKDLEQIRRDKRQESIRILEDEFRVGFADEIPLLEEAGIKWSAHFQDPDYEFKGAYILFEKDDKRLKMDFASRGSYRYEYVPYSLEEYAYRGSMVYGNWTKEEFILWIDENLLHP